MEPLKRVSLDYSWKNIPVPSRDAFTKRLIEMVEGVIKRMRWKAFFFLSRGNEDQDRDTDDHFGLKSQRSPPRVEELKNFEADMLKLIEDLEFRNTRPNAFQKSLKSDIQQIKKSDALLVPSDKTRNLYEMERAQYEKLLRENVTKRYKHASCGTYDDINAEALQIAEKLKVADRMESLARRDAFITLKDHKDNFAHSLPCRLINPAKSEVGLISKRILDRVNTSLKGRLNVLQWKESSAVIDWFKAIEDKDRCVFTTFDIVDFYPSISEELLRKALGFARQLTDISDDEIEIIFHSRKTLLFSGGAEWIKKDSNLFDVTMGSYDGAEICELVGAYALAQLPEKYSVGLYRDDGLAVHRGITGSQADRTRKDLIKRFSALGLKITIETYLKIVNFLDLTLDLHSGTYSPFRKPNDTPTYVNISSNHPPAILKNIPFAVSRRLSVNSSDEEVFRRAAPAYGNALAASGYTQTVRFLEGVKNKSSHDRRRQRHRKVIWFNPPYGSNVKTRIGKRFLHLIGVHFPKGSKLHPIFNRNTIKVSYSCMPNVSDIIKGHNSSVLRAKQPLLAAAGAGTAKLCNCRNRNQCPLSGKCLSEGVVYMATVRPGNNDPSMQYFGLTEGPFKTRFNNHQLNFRHEKYENTTELAKHVWGLKRHGIDFDITWEICRQVSPTSISFKRCDLCLTEKLYIIRARRQTTLNRRSELVSTCRHKNKRSLRGFLLPAG